MVNCVLIKVSRVCELEGSIPHHALLILYNKWYNTVRKQNNVLTAGLYDH